jgi:hypothetical protein
MNLNEVIVTHNHLRVAESLPEMIAHVKANGLWDADYLKRYSELKGIRLSPIIQLSRFEDGKVFLHDGHHRAAATFLAGRAFLYPSEFHVTQWKYSEYLEISHPNGWYTPFDPRTHVRTPNFSRFKRMAKELFITRPELAEKWILENKHLFSEPRKHTFVPEFAKGELK